MTKSTKRTEAPDGDGDERTRRSRPPKGVTVRVVYDPDREAQIEALIAVFDSATPPAPSTSPPRREDER